MVWFLLEVDLLAVWMVLLLVVRLLLVLRLVVVYTLGL